METRWAPGERPCGAAGGQGPTPAAGSSGRGTRAWPRAVLLLACLAAAGCGFFVKPEGELLPDREKAPLFALADQDGRVVSLRDALDRGPALLVFYRGHW